MISYNYFNILYSELEFGSHVCWYTVVQPGVVGLGQCNLVYLEKRKKKNWDIPTKYPNLPEESVGASHNQMM